MLRHTFFVSLVVVGAVVQGFVTAPARRASPAAVARRGAAEAVRPAVSMGFFGGGGGGGGGGGAAGRVSSEIRSGVTLFTTSNDGSSKRAKATLDKLGCTYEEVQLDKDPDGAAIRAELKKRTNVATLPFIFIKGQFVGGLSSGGPVGGINGLMKGDMLQPMLEGAGAVKRSRLDSTPLAPLRGNNLRNALGSLGGGGNPFDPFK